MIDGVLGIDVSKNTIDVSMSGCNKIRAKSFANSADGWCHLLAWLITQKIQRVHADPKLKARFADLGAAVFPSSPADFGKLIADETEKWAKVIRAAKIKAE